MMLAVAAPAINLDALRTIPELAESNNHITKNVSLLVTRVSWSSILSQGMFLVVVPAKRDIVDSSQQGWWCSVVSLSDPHPQYNLILRFRLILILNNLHSPSYQVIFFLKRKQY